MPIKEISVRDVTTEFGKVTGELIQLVESFSQEQFNTIPFEGSWSPAQVAEHLRKGYHGADKLLVGPSKPAGRDPAEKIEQIRKTFLDFSIKMESPEFVVPQQKNYDRVVMLKALTESRQKILSATERTDLLTIPSGFTFPGFGELTGLELLSFFIVHTRRHIRQLRNIREKLV